MIMFGFYILIHIVKGSCVFFVSRGFKMCFFAVDCPGVDQKGTTRDEIKQVVFSHYPICTEKPMCSMHMQKCSNPSTPSMSRNEIKSLIM